MQPVACLRHPGRLQQADGIITFENLHPGVQYRLTELEAPAGYVLLSDNVDLEELPVDDFVEELTVYSTTGYTIPATGVNDPLYGMTVLGAFIMAMAVMMFSILAFDFKKVRK